ncbi:MAG: MATE family efflux transporter [Candidatus Latescibacteria bacterium]|nr:MATE family efflux transporter [Candidatus Latescibacterota bacterium]
MHFKPPCVWQLKWHRTESILRRIDFSITRPYLTLTLPLALGSQMENLVGFAEMFMVRSLGTEAISAVGISRTIVMLIGITMIAVATGTMTMVAQAVGAKNWRDASETAKQSVTLVTAISSAISLFGYLTSDLALNSLSVPPEISALAVPYLQVFFATVPLMALQRTLDTCLHAAGDTKTPFYISIISNISHLIAAYLLIFGIWGLPQLGVVGAAAGGVVGGVVGNICRFWALYSGRFALTLLPNTSYIPEWDRARRLLKIGIPSALQGLFRNGSNVVYLKLIALTANPTVALAAYSIGNQMERMLRRSSLSFGTATTSLVGRRLGAGDPDEAEIRGWTTLLISMAGLALLGIPIVLLAPQFMRIFTEDTNVISIGIIYLYAMAAAEPFMCAAITSGAALRAAGDTVPALVYTIIAQWIIRLPAAYLLAFTLGFDINGIWIALVIFSALQGTLTVRKFAQGHWKIRRI